MIAVVFALPQESQDFVAALKTQRIDPGQVAVVHTGMGPTAARAAFWRFWDEIGEGCLEGVIGAGFAGGLDPSLPSGTLLLAENHPTWLPPMQAVLGNRARILPVASVSEVLETPQAKADCARRTGAAAVDMESAAIAAFCREKNVPFVGVRVISDAANEAVPIPSAIWLDVTTQRPRPLALIRFLLRHPARILPFARFVASIHRSRHILTAALLELVQSNNGNSREKAQDVQKERWIATSGRDGLAPAILKPRGA